MAPWVILFVLSIFGGMAVAADLEPGETGIVSRVIDGDTFVLSDGLEVRLIGLQAPKLPLGRPGFPTWPLAPEAKSALEQIVLDRMVSLSYGGAQRDRYGRALAQAHRADGFWVQGDMIRRGMARVYSFKDNRVCVGVLLALEAEARDARRGMWRLDGYRIRSVPETFDAFDTFQIVEGRVLSAARIGGRTFLNFGEDWRTDFTGTVAPGDHRPFDADGLDLLGLEGKKVRLRGWLTSYNGPNMVITHPEQIEILGNENNLETATQSPCQTGPLI